MDTEICLFPLKYKKLKFEHFERIFKKLTQMLNCGFSDKILITVLHKQETNWFFLGL